MLCAFLVFVMEAALLVADASAAQLDTGVADKLKGAAAALGSFSVPAGAAPVNGMKWGMLAQQAQLTRAEYLAVAAWLEEAWSEAMSKRMLGAISVLRALAMRVPECSSRSTKIRGLFE